MDGNESSEIRGKSLISSKINWLAGMMAILGVVSDPQFGGMFIPVEYLPRVLMGASAALFVLRTFFSGEPIVWRRD